MSFSHHATLIYAPSVETVASQIGLDRSSADHFVCEREIFGINDVRLIQSHATGRPVVGSERLIVLVATTIASEAQHALLKLLEEPASTTRIVIVLSGSAPLLPTVLSRVAVVNAAVVMSNEYDEYTTWVRSSYAERIAEITTRASKKDSAWMRRILRSATVNVPVHTLTYPRCMHDLATWSQLRGASQKMLLEQLALTVPVVKR